MANKISIDISEIQAIVREYPDAATGVMRAKVSEALMLLESAIKEITPFGAGPIHLRDSIFTDVIVSGIHVEGTVGTPLEHGIPVEQGTKPHFPPIEPIRFWVEQKLHIAEPQSRSVAFLIARAISRRGTKGAGMFERAFKDNESRVMAILNEIPVEIVRRLGQINV